MPGCYLLADITFHIKPPKTSHVGILYIADWHWMRGGATHLMHHVGDGAVSDEESQLLSHIGHHLVL